MCVLVEFCITTAEWTRPVYKHQDGEGTGRRPDYYSFPVKQATPGKKMKEKTGKSRNSCRVSGGARRVARTSAKRLGHSAQGLQWVPKTLFVFVKKMIASAP